MTAYAPGAALVAALLGAAHVQATAAACQAARTASAPTVIELYTSEGCSSCPPAERWLSSIKAGPDVVAMAFHVDYWDRLGWPDRFASPEASARQRELASLAGSRQVYTPQVLVNGRDWRHWPQLPAHRSDTTIGLTLSREGDEVSARVAPLGASTARLAGYWAVLEDRHVSQVRAGENAGRTLRHDHVVRLYRPVPAWAAASGGTSRLRVSPGVAPHPRRIVFVVTDATTRQPLQALALGC